MTRVAFHLCVASTVFGTVLGEGRETVSAPLDLRFDFTQDLEGWLGGFADYPAGEEDSYELAFSYASLPAEIQPAGGAFFISGNNHSDDLFMFLKRRLVGLAPYTRYELRFAVEIATNAPSDCFGVGAPGTSVTLKVGATAHEPQTLVPEVDGLLRLNIDKGNQAVGGADMVAVGHIGNARKCPDETYERKTLDSGEAPFVATTDGAGELWLIVGSDSGFEATTSLYYDSVSVALAPASSATFRRGDANSDRATDISDALSTFGWLFFGGTRPTCVDAADSNDDGEMDVSDGVFTLTYLFLSGPRPPAPGTDDCGADPTADDLGCDLHHLCD